MTDIHFVDTTIRDGHQSLWAENMTTGMMLPIAERMDHENICSKRCRADGRQRNIRKSRI